MRFNIKTIPLTCGIITNGGDAYRGITYSSDDAMHEQLVLYDLNEMMTSLTLSDIINRGFAPSEIVDGPMAKSDKGELFFGRYIVHDEDAFKGYKLEGYDPETGMLRTTIPISEYVDEDWEDHRVADVIRIDDDRVMVACYDDAEYPGAGFSVYFTILRQKKCGLWQNSQQMRQIRNSISSILDLIDTAGIYTRAFPKTSTISTILLKRQAGTP